MSSRAGLAAYFFSKSGRLARVIEYDPLYCDVIIRRWEKLTGKSAELASDGRPFDEVAEVRCGGGHD